MGNIGKAYMIIIGQLWGTFVLILIIFVYWTGHVRVGGVSWRPDLGALLVVTVSRFGAPRFRRPRFSGRRGPAFLDAFRSGPPELFLLN